MANYTREEIKAMLEKEHSFLDALNHISTLVPYRIKWEGMTMVHRPELYSRFPQFSDRPFAYFRGGVVRYLTQEEAFQKEDKSNGY